MRKSGLFIVIEGSDGSGKATQLNLLKERLSAIGYDVAMFDFPRYGQSSSYFVKKYLNGDYGPAADVSPYTASLFYALDRYEAAKEIKRALDDGKIVLSNRYTGANMAHQGAKFSDPVEQRGFFVWADNLEFQLLSIPRPDINVFLRVPVAISQKLIEQRAAKSGKPLDEHEKDSSHLKKALATYDTLCQLFPRDFKTIECTKNEKLLTIPQINNLIWQYLQPKLPTERPNPSHSVVVTLGLSQAPNQKTTSSNQDSINIPFKNASLLLRLQIERLVPGSVQPDLSNLINSPAVYSPGNLPTNLSQAYRQALQTIHKLHLSIQTKINAYIDKNPSRQLEAKAVTLPLICLAQLTDFDVSLSKSDIKIVASQLLASDSDEVVWAAKQLYLFARQTWPNEFKDPLETADDQLVINNAIAKLADDRLPLLGAQDESVKLLEATPRQEFNLLAESIYPFSNLPLNEISEEVNNWPYRQKFDSLRQAIVQPTILASVNYKLDLITNSLIMTQLAKALNLKSVPIQAITPRYGYDVPAIIEAADADDLYDDIFDESLRLFSLLQGAGRDDLTGYSALLGHKVRWQLNVDAASLRNILSARGLDAKVVQSITEKVAEVHPLIWEILSNSNLSLPEIKRNGRARVKPAHRRTTRKPPSNK